MYKKKFTNKIILILFLLSAHAILPQRFSGKLISISENKKTEQSDYINTSADNKSTVGESAVFTMYSFDRNTHNYFRVDQTGKSLWNGKHWRPEDFPLDIYVKSCTSGYFKTLFKNYVDYALGIWEQADPRIKFRYVSGEKNADIIIVFEENLQTKYDDSYLGMTDYDLTPGKEIEKSVVEVSLLKFGDETLTDGEVKATIIHEMGHALGLGHSENEFDVMFPFIDPFSDSEMRYDELSGGDVQAVRSVVDLGYKLILN